VSWTGILFQGRGFEGLVQQEKVVALQKQDPILITARHYQIFLIRNIRNTKKTAGSNSNNMLSLSILSFTQQ